MNEHTVAIEILPEELRKMQLLQLEILKEIDRICRKYQIKYTLCGGSLLGAIRHGGFIPWDDDIDITMLRKDYEYFLNVCKTELDEKKFFLQTVDTDPEYRLIYGRILLNGTAFVRAGQEHMKSRNGIFVDIFPRDGQSDNVGVAYIQEILAYLMRKMLYSPVGARNSHSYISRVGFWGLSKFPKGCALKLLKLIQMLNFGKETEIVACWGIMSNRERKKLELGKSAYKQYKKNRKRISGSQKEKQRELEKGLRRSFFTAVEDISFENMEVMITSHYDAWLTYNYDDYMKLPPKEKQVMHQTVSYYSLGEYND